MKLIKKIKVDKLKYGFEELKITILPVATTSNTHIQRWISLDLYFNLNKITNMDLPNIQLLNYTKIEQEGKLIVTAVKTIYDKPTWLRFRNYRDAEYFIRISISDRVFIDEVMKDILNDTTRLILDSYKKAYESNKSEEQRLQEQASESLRRSEAAIKHLKNFF